MEAHPLEVVKTMGLMFLPRKSDSNEDDMPDTPSILRPDVVHEYESFPSSAECTLGDFETTVKEMAVQWTGVESPREVNPGMVSELFREESMPWRGIATRHVGLVWEAVRRFVDLALRHCGDSSILDELKCHVIDSRS